MGALFVSTDGAGVGAWCWRKRPAGWEVIEGNTGWRRLGWQPSGDGAPPEFPPDITACTTPAGTLVRLRIVIPTGGRWQHCAIPDLRHLCGLNPDDNTRHHPGLLVRNVSTMTAWLETRSWILRLHEHGRTEVPTPGLDWSGSIWLPWDAGKNWPATTPGTPA